MSGPEPHYLLFAEAVEDGTSARWRFLLQSADGRERLEAEEAEPAVRGERLGLLAVVRALESLDRPSRVTLVACPDYVRRGLVYGLDDWRRQGWRWEWFDQLVPVRNSDLWQRMDRAMAFHRLEAAGWRFDPPHRVPRPHVVPAAAPNALSMQPGRGKAVLPSDVLATNHRPAATKWGGCAGYDVHLAASVQHTSGAKAVRARRLLHCSLRQLQWLCAYVRRALREAVSRAAARVTQLCTPLTPPPWYG